MTQKDLNTLHQHPNFIQLVQRKKRLTWSLTIAMLVVYFGFVLMMAFTPEILARSIAGGVTSVGIPLFIGAVLLSFIFTAIYVHQSNKILDPITEKLMQEYEQ